MKTNKDLHINNNDSHLVPELDFDEDYLSRFELEDVLNDEFIFINIRNKTELSESWNNVDLQHLWRFNLHYFEYLYRLAYEYSHNNNQVYYDKFKCFTESWIRNNPFASGDG